MISGMDPRTAETGVLAVLSGTPLDQAATEIGMEPAELADALDVYRVAGSVALAAQAGARDWYQVHIEFGDWARAEQIAAIHLAPRLRHAQDAGLTAGWWFMRKAPCWRLRLRPGRAGLADMTRTIRCVLQGLTAAGLTERWWESIYEPESIAFGGIEGMQAAHDLFHADSLAVLDYLHHRETDASAEPMIGRRELSVLLCSALFRAAGQDWHEQGDIWHRVTRMRPLPLDTPTDRLPDMAHGLRRLMSVDTHPAGALCGACGPLAFAVPWIAAFDQAGQRLAGAAHSGALERGVRDILAQHVIFHWNRLGLSTPKQAILAWAACDTVMNPSSSLTGPP